MIACEVGGVLIVFMGCMGWVYEKVSREVRMVFLVILGLRWVTAPRLDFGNEVWCRDHTFKVAFWESFNIAFYKDASLVDHLESSSDSHQWSINFIRAA
jgi:hypothetical protein